MNETNSISGLFSGIDTYGLVEKLIDFERRPAYVLEARRAQEQLRLAGYDALEAALQGLKSSIEGLRRPVDFRDMRATVTHFDILTASSGAGAQAGTYSLSIQNLAQSHQATSGGYATEDAILGTGTVTISVAGTEAVSVELTEGNNTLGGLAEAINAANGGVGASVVNVGGGANPYQLILTGSSTGEAQLVTVAHDLSGGAGLSFGGVDPVVVGTMAGSSAVTSGGHYTGAGDAAFSFSVSTGGVIGADAIVIDWTNDQGDSGQIELEAGYAGEAVQVHGGLTLSFGAGDLVAGDDWTVDATSGTIQAAQDALIHFGAAGGGGQPIEVTSASNTVTGLIPGVTLDLHRADPTETVTVTVENDIDAVVGRVQSFVDSYNSLIGFFTAQFDYNAEAESAGTLLGDRIAMRLDENIRNAVQRSVAGLATEFSYLREIGIGSSAGDTLNADGSLAIDDTALRAALRDDMASVVGLLASSGTSSDADVIFLNASYTVEPTGSDSSYDVRITQAAERGRYTGASIAEPSAGTPLVIDASNGNLKLKVDGITSGDIALVEGSYENGADLAAMIQTAVNADADLGNVGVTVNWVDDGGGQGHLLITSSSYGITSVVHVEDVADSIAGDVGLTGGSPLAGRDVAGYFLVDGVEQAASGSGRILTGSEDGAETDGLSLQVNLTDAMLASQGEEQGSIQVFSGIFDNLHRVLSSSLDTEAGIIERRQEAMRETIEDYGDQVEQIDARLEIRRQRYLREFIRMESLMAEMNTNSQSFLAMIQSLPAIGSTGSRNSNG